MHYTTDVITFWLLHNVYTDDIKTKDQKDKEAKLLQELLKTVEERNNIEQRKMTTQAQ